MTASGRIGALTRVTGLALGAGLLVALGGCQLGDSGDDKVNGKELFVQKCGACHVLRRAGTTGAVGPNLDEAFQRARVDGFSSSTIEGMVHRQILYPARSAQDTGARMPAKLVEGDDARDVAAYVAAVAARSGDDSGLLAEAGKPKGAGKTAEAASGVLEIDTDPSGALAYLFGAANAPAGALTLKSKNASSIPHNIAIEGGGVNEKGEVVQDGGVSEIKLDLKPGTYTFFCSVPGHREGGMEGKLTVK
jgi:mono/diheme cytochrome c family protein